jgi:hypothetical protein
MREEIKCGQKEMNSTETAFQEKMDALIANRKNDRKEMSCQETTEARLQCEEPASGAIKDAQRKMTTCQNTMEANTVKTEPDQGMMSSMEEHQGIPKGEVTVMPVRELRKQRRVQKLAAECRQKPKERTLGYCGSWKRVTVAGKRMSHHATVAWRKRKLIWRIGIEENCGPCKELTTAEMRESPECKNGIRHRDVKEPPHLRRGRKTTTSVGGLNRREQPRLENVRKCKDILWKTFRLEIV